MPANRRLTLQVPNVLPGGRSIIWPIFIQDPGMYEVELMLPWWVRRSAPPEDPDLYEEWEDWIGG